MKTEDEISIATIRLESELKNQHSLESFLVFRKKPTGWSAYNSDSKPFTLNLLNWQDEEIRELKKSLASSGIIKEVQLRLY
jgi:hypothetical protein